MNSRERAFCRKVLAHYTAHGRHKLPWRHTHNPYRILVSEVMLQQTQVDRIIPKYKEFLQQFPTVRALASAPLQEVMRTWQGLGYNRRAKMLHEAAQEIVARHHGVFPKEKETLQALRGIGPYTASAVMVFAFNQKEVCIETNIRAVYLHEFFNGIEDVHDKVLMPLIARTVSNNNPREWYFALMDYGAHVKRTTQNPSRRSRHHTVQKPFKGSLRETRGSIVKLLAEKSRTQVYLHAHAVGDTEQISQALMQLEKERMLVRKGRLWMVAT